MELKNVSNRKPKMSKPVSSVEIGGSSKSHQGEGSHTQFSVKDGGVGFNRGSKNPVTGWNKNVTKEK